MKFLKRREPLPIAIDFGTHHLKLLQLEERAGKLAVLAAHQTLMPRHMAGNDRMATALAAIREQFRQGSFHGNAANIVLPREHVQVKTLRLPLLPEHELKAAIELESGRLFAQHSEKLAVRFIVAGEVRQGAESRTETIVLAVEQSLIEDLLERLNQIGLRVTAFDFEPCSIYRGISRFMRRKSDENEVNVLVDVGARQSQVVIGRGQEMTFVKTIEIGGDTFNDCVAQKLGLSVDEARSLRRRFSDSSDDTDSVGQTVAGATRKAMEELAHEIALCLRYYSVTFRGQRPSRVRLLGGEANDSGLCNVLATSLVVPVEVYEPLLGITHDFPAPGQSAFSEWGVAFGAALRGLKSSVSREPADPVFGRRKNDPSLVEVVDLGSALHVTADPLKPQEVASA